MDQHNKSLPVGSYLSSSAILGSPISALPYVCLVPTLQSATPSVILGQAMQQGVHVPRRLQARLSLSSFLTYSLQDSVDSKFAWYQRENMSPPIYTAYFNPASKIARLSLTSANNVSQSDSNQSHQATRVIKPLMVPIDSLCRRVSGGV